MPNFNSAKIFTSSPNLFAAVFGCFSCHPRAKQLTLPHLEYSLGKSVTICWCERKYSSSVVHGTSITALFERDRSVLTCPICKNEILSLEETLELEAAVRLGGEAGGLQVLNKLKKLMRERRRLILQTL